MASCNVVQFPINPNTIFPARPSKRGRGRLPQGVVAFHSRPVAGDSNDEQHAFPDEYELPPAIKAIIPVISEHLSKMHRENAAAWLAIFKANIAQVQRENGTYVPFIE